MTNRDLVLACLNHEEGPVPQWTMAFFNRQLVKRLMPEQIYPSFHFIPVEDSMGFDPLDEAELDDIIAFNRYIDKCSVGAGRGANACFGHGGPGEFNCRIYERGDNYFKVAYETGAKHFFQLKPHNYHIFELPMQTSDDLDEITLPDPDDHVRYSGFARDVKYLKSKGEFTHGHINGFFSGMHYFFMDYEQVLMGFYLEPEGQKRVMRRLGEWNLAAAKNMLDAGVDCITLCDDLGTEESLLVSPAIFREFIKPWYVELNRLVHSYEGRYTHLHCHGSIMTIFPDLVEAGFDMINPLDPCEGMDLTELKEHFGQKVTLVGGTNKHFFDWDPDTQYNYYSKVINTGRKGGGFMLMDSGGVPENISQEKWNYILRISRELRQYRAV